MISFKLPQPLPVGYRVSIRNVLGITFLSVLFFVIVGAIIAQLDPGIFKDNRNRAEALLWFSLLLTTGVLTATGYVLAWRTPQRWGIVGLIRPEAQWILIAITVGAVLFFVGERADNFFRLGIMGDFRDQFGTGLKTQVGLVSLFAARVLLLPIALEVYFRGVLLNFFATRFGPEAGLFIAAILFSGLFFRPDLPISMAYGFIYGIAYGLLFVRSGSLWPAIVANGTVSALIIAKAAWV
ncbi:MAG: membrane protease YdiL (CAAX protease family) [Alphaproteobacteria bacterium]|jgi:membrane protease YdiL (CAAX protease family)